MTNKFIINEDEKRRILNLHEVSRKSQHLGLITEADDSFTVGDVITLENSKNGGSELKLFKGTVFKINVKGLLYARTNWQKVGDLMGSVEGSGSGVVFYRCASGKYSLQSETNLPTCPIVIKDSSGNSRNSFTKCKNLFYNQSYPTLKVKAQKLCQASQSFIPNAITTTTTTVKGGGGTGNYTGTGNKTVVDPVTATGVVTPTGTRADLETEYGGPITQAALDDMLTKI